MALVKHCSEGLLAEIASEMNEEVVSPIVSSIVSNAISTVEVPPNHADYDTLLLCVQQLVKQLKGLSE